MNTDTKNSEQGHISVLLHESIDGLNLKAGDIFLDCTLGSGGHSAAVAEHFGDTVQIIGVDMDADALARTRVRFASLKANAVFVQNNFRNIDQVLAELHLEKVDKILMDLGLSSNQFEESGRGFSFQKDEPLEMTFKKDPGVSDVSARTIVNEWSEDTLETILKGFGEERYAWKIAKAIGQYRIIRPIETTLQLVEIITSATPIAYHHRKIHPATKTFQALRIAANDELTALKEALQKGMDHLNHGGRMAVISFHSLEDRIVKNFFRDLRMNDQLIPVTKKPIVPSEEELIHNRRARSAKLRIIEKK